jgi:hypothetical protein
MSLVAAVFAVPAAGAQTPTILVDGAVVQTDVPPMIVDGHVLVPLRDVFERFGADVSFDAAKGIVTARRYGIAVKIAVDTSDAWIDGKHVSLEVPAREFAGRIEVPLRFVADALGVAVDYDAATNTVAVVSGLRPGNFVAAGPGTPTISGASSYVSGAQSVIAPTLEEQRPSPGSLIGSEYPQIYARFNGGSSPVDPGTVRLLLDGSDVTNSATVSSAYVAYTPSSALYGGTHTVEISGQADNGTPFDEQWSFRIQSDMSSGYVSSVIGYSPPAFGYSRFGFSPPGFSVFAPGPQFFVEDEPIVVVFFSPFFSGNGFFTISGFPGQFGMTPWLGCPGFFWSSFTVPAGIVDPDAIVAARFTTNDGRTVVVHSTAPLHIDGTRRSLPSNIRFAVRARLMNKPVTPRALVAFRRTEPVVRIQPVARALPIGRRSPVGGVAPIARIPVRRTLPIGRLIPVARPMPIVRRVEPVVIMPRVVPPAPLQIPMRPAPVVVPAPQPVTIPRKPPQ